MTLAFLVLALQPWFPAAAGSPQENPAPPPMPTLPGTGAAPLLDVDGHALERGRLPASTTKPARERWERVLASSLPPIPRTEKDAPPAVRAPITAFDLSIDLRYRLSDASTNDMPNVRYQWLAPDFVRADSGRSRAHVRGPLGSFLVDESKPDHVERVKLDVSREAVEDRRLIDEYAGIAGNLARLSDPQSVRIRKLVELGAPPAILPDRLARRAQAPAWIELESPDFYVVRAPPGANALARVDLGVYVVAQRVEIALVDDARAPLAGSFSTAVLALAQYEPVDGFQVPHQIQVWMPEPQSSSDPDQKPVLRQTPMMDLFVKSASLRAALKPEDFLPTVPLFRPN